MVVRGPVIDTRGLQGVALLWATLYETGLRAFLRSSTPVPRLARAKENRVRLSILNLTFARMLTRGGRRSVSSGYTSSRSRGSLLGI